MDFKGVNMTYSEKSSNCNSNFIPSYPMFVPSPPVIPKLYYDVYSQEERIKRICCEIEKLTQYSNLLSSAVNDIEDDVNESLQETLDTVNKRLKELEDELIKIINQVVGSSFDWDVTSGSLQPTIAAHRLLYRWVSVHAMTVEELNAKNMTVSELSECGLNCAGVAFESRNGLNNKMNEVPYDYIYNGTVQ